MIGEANSNARDSAEQFARDSGATVGRIKNASQGYFSVGPRDGEECEDCGVVRRQHAVPEGPGSDDDRLRSGLIFRAHQPASA